MNWNLVRLCDVAPAPWRNGGGVTRELAVSAGKGEWHWRMSVAEVDASGPFSCFEGVDRWFVVLEGTGVQLDVQGQTLRLKHNSAPFYFDGGATTYCTLLEGRTQDFNLMVRRSLAPARMLRINSSASFTLDAPKTIAAYAMNSGTTVQIGSQAVRIPPQSLAWTTLRAGDRVDVVAEQALWMEIPE
jgi:uncharacterized protein